MNITFLIGNGFDLNLNLKTSYQSFYRYYINQDQGNSQITEWLKRDEGKWEDWADLEARLGEKVSEITEKTIDKFIEDKFDLDNKLLDYLEQEQSKMIIEGHEEEIAKEISRSLLGYYKELNKVEREELMKTYKIFEQEEYVYNFLCFNYTSTIFEQEEYVYNFLCFNYTSTLDILIEKTREIKAQIGVHSSNYGDKKNLLGQVLHIHGTLTEGMVLGVNDIEQIYNSSLKENPEFIDIFVKKRMNDNMGQKRTEDAKNMISTSQVICIFGMSIGLTDTMWWQEVMVWLKQSKDHRLIICVKEDENVLGRKIPSKMIPLNSKNKRDFLLKSGVEEDDSQFLELKKRVFILYNPNIFNFQNTGIMPV